MNQPIRTHGVVSKKAASISEDIAIQALEDEAKAPENAAEAPTEEADAQLSTPLDRWRANVAKAGLTEDEANSIVDSIIQTGHYERGFSLFRGRVKLRLRTRSSLTLRRVGDALDLVRSNDARVHNQVMYRLLLIDSIASFQTTTFEFPRHDAPPERHAAAMQQRADFVDSLNERLYEAVMGALARFDAIVAAACSEGGVDGF